MSVSRQSFIYSVVGYLGFLLGTLSNLFLFTYDLEFYGKLRFIFSVVQLIIPFVVFGLPFAVVKFFPLAKKENNKCFNLLSLSLLGVIVNFLIFLLIFFLLYFKIKNTYTWHFKWIILPLVLIMALSSVWNKYISNYAKVAFPNVFESLFPKLANITAFVLFLFCGASYFISYTVYLLFFIIALIGYIVYAYFLDPFRLDFSTDFWKENNRWKSVVRFCFYTCIANAGNLLLLHSGVYFTSEFIGFKYSGIYATLFSVSTLISIPAMGLYTLSAPMINLYLSENNFSTLESYYKKTSLSLFFVGTVLFSMLYIAFVYISDIMPYSGQAIQQFRPMLLIFGVSLLFELSTGFNSHIISMSRYYTVGVYFSLVSMVICVILNYIFIVVFDLGIWGSALAYCISNIGFNVMKTIFNYRNFGIHPFSVKMIRVLLLCFVSYGISFLIPETPYIFLNLVYKPMLILVLVLLANLFLPIYPLKEILHTFRKR